jgi:hypothetical protein
MRVMKADEETPALGGKTQFCEYLNQYIENYSMSWAT